MNHPSKSGCIRTSLAPGPRLLVAAVALMIGAAACSSTASTTSIDTSAPTTAASSTTLAPIASTTTTEPAPTTTTEPATTTTEPATATTEPATTTTLSLEQTIASHWQGAFLHVVGGGAPEPRGTTVMYFLKGDWGAEVYWKTDNEWCALSTFTWTVTDATSETAFSLDFQDTNHFDSCLVVPNEGVHFVWTPTGTRTVDGRTVYDGNYTVPAQYPASRTACSKDWADPAPCGFAAAAAALPTPPAN